MGCSTDKQDHQPFPRKGILSHNSNLPLYTLRRVAGAEESVAYCYVVDSVRNEGGRFLQGGSGPNFQGDMVTLCTCKHHTHTSLSSVDWEGKWVAGFTGLGAGGGKNALVYLTKIGHAFESHHDLWYSVEILPETKRAKAATLNRLEDLFEPIDELSDPFDHRGYHSPHETHSHAPNNGWYRDVDRTGYGGAGRPCWLETRGTPSCGIDRRSSSRTR
jgi:hypothetical protein